MKDQVKEDRIMFLLKVWFFLTESNMVWPDVKNWVEVRLNEELK